MLLPSSGLRVYFCLIHCVTVPGCVRIKTCCTSRVKPQGRQHPFLWLHVTSDKSTKFVAPIILYICSINIFSETGAIVYEHASLRYYLKAPQTFFSPQIFRYCSCLTFPMTEENNFSPPTGCTQLGSVTICPTPAEYCENTALLIAA